MAELNLTINGKNYSIFCDDGQEQRVLDLGHYVDERLKEIASAGAATNESHLLVLASLMLADEVFDLRDGANQNSAAQAPAAAPQNGMSEEDEHAVAEAIDALAQRIEAIAAQVQEA